MHDAWNAVYVNFYEGWATWGRSRGVERVSRLVEELADRVLEWAGGAFRGSVLRLWAGRRSFDIGHYLLYVSFYHILAGVSGRLGVSV